MTAQSTPHVRGKSGCNARRNCSTRPPPPCLPCELELEGRSVLSPPPWRLSSPIVPSASPKTNSWMSKGQSDPNKVGPNRCPRHTPPSTMGSVSPTNSPSQKRPDAKIISFQNNKRCENKVKGSLRACARRRFHLQALRLQRKRMYRAYAERSISRGLVLPSS